MTLLKSWIKSANQSQCDFPLNNLPYGVYSNGGEHRLCTAIGDQILDITHLQKMGYLPSINDVDTELPTWNTVIEQGIVIWTALRNELTELLIEKGNDALEKDADLQKIVFISISSATMHLPIKVAEFTDFYSNKHHATNVGTMFRGAKNALPPNWLHIPIGYNGRASSVIVSGTDVIRPMGQLKLPSEQLPRFEACKRLDIELELGAIIGKATYLGDRVSVREADDMIFGYVLLNDWSARDIQAWEYQPLGPFQAKAFATSISPWIITKAALEPFRCDTPKREFELLDYIKDDGPMLYNIDLSVDITPNDGKVSTTICRTNYNEMYYSSAQQLAHHSSSGCAMNVGDLLGSGTISGSTKESRGSFLELSWGAEEPLILDTGEVRTFLEDGDTVTLRGHAQGNGYRIGFGECTGTILAAKT